MSSTSSQTPPPRTWLIVGASRGIGFEFVRQLRALKQRVVATVRTPPAQIEAGDFFGLSKDREETDLAVLLCDVTCEESIVDFAAKVALIPWLKEIDVVVLNAGVLKYPSRATEAYVDIHESLYHSLVEVNADFYVTSDHSLPFNITSIPTLSDL